MITVLCICCVDLEARVKQAASCRGVGLANVLVEDLTQLTASLIHHWCDMLWKLEKEPVASSVDDSVIFVCRESWSLCLGTADGKHTKICSVPYCFKAATLSSRNVSYCDDSDHFNMKRSKWTYIGLLYSWRYIYSCAFFQHQTIYTACFACCGWRRMNWTRTKNRGKSLPLPYQ